MLTDYYTTFTLKENTPGVGIYDDPSFTVVGYYKGFIQPVSSSEIFLQGKSAEVATHRLYTGMRTPIEKGQQVSQFGQSYIVISDIIQPKGISGVNHHREVLMGIIE